MLARDEHLTGPQQVISQAASTTPARQLPRPNTVKARLTSKRPQRLVENDEYAAFISRILRAYSRRVGEGDVEALALMLNLAEEIDTAITEAVKGLRAHGYSWAEIGSRPTALNFRDFCALVSSFLVMRHMSVTIRVRGLAGP